MPLAVEQTDDAGVVLAAASTFLAAEPVRHNLLTTLLLRCDAVGGRGRFWIARDDRDVLGVAYQWPRHFVATVAPMPRSVAERVVDAIVEAGIDLPGVNGDAVTASTFAGRWTERTRGAARPVGAMRLYEVATVVPTAAPGRCRLASADDAARLTEWTAAFEQESGVPLSTDAAAVVTQRLADGQLWIWEADGPVAFLGLSASVNGAVRVGPVYTPPEHRGRGFGSALTAERSAHVRSIGDRCLLYADLGNATSNGIYRAIGYRAVGETLRYEFGPRR